MAFFVFVPEAEHATVYAFYLHVGHCWVHFVFYWPLIAYMLHKILKSSQSRIHFLYISVIVDNLTDSLVGQVKVTSFSLKSCVLTAH